MRRFGWSVAAVLYWCVAVAIVYVSRIDDHYTWATASPDRVAAGNERALIAFAILAAIFLGVAALCKRIGHKH